MKIKKFKRISSTQEYAEKMKSRGENLIVTAKSQSGGKGTKGRSFSSNEGGVYLSTVFYYRNFSKKKAFLIMAGMCAAVCRTLEENGLSPKIKWPNDVFVNGKKICGILTENTFSAKKSSDNLTSFCNEANGVCVEGENGVCNVCSICGVGLNVKNELPIELEQIATTIALETLKRQSVKKWRAKLIKNLLLTYDLLNTGNEEDQRAVFESYRSYFGFIGKNAEVVCPEGSFIARILGVDDTGRLRVVVGGEEKKYSAAEIIKIHV